MTGDELLVACFGTSDFPAPLRTVEMQDEETGHVLSHLDIYLRRVIVRRRPSPGAIVESSTTIPVAFLTNICTDPAHRRQGRASALIRRAHVELVEHRPLSFAVVRPETTDYDGYFSRLGYSKPPDAPAGFLVARLGEEEWPHGSLRLTGWDGP